jgi:ribosome-binding factor A
MSTHDRAARVAEQFQHALSEILSRGLKDPRVRGFVTVTGAKMPPDLKSVTVYLSVHGDDRTREDTLAGLKAAAGYLQREAARALGLRYVPHLTFHYDPSVAEGDKIERLLRSVRPAAQARGVGERPEAAGDAAGAAGRGGEGSGERPPVAGGGAGQPAEGTTPGAGSGPPAGPDAGDERA